MSSRQEEKERRRQERIAREQAQAGKAANRRRLQLVAGAVLAIGAIVAIVAAIAAGGGDSSGPSTEGSNARIPAKEISDFDEAVRAAGCTYKNYPSQGREHLTSDKATFDKYKTNPPTSGTHRPTPAQDGIYDPGNEPAQENVVHTMEHGRIVFQYKPGTPQRRIDQLEALFNEPLKGVAGYHQVVMQNNSDMPYAVAATAWTQLLGCNEFTDKTFDALRAFRERFVDKGPELIP